MASFYSSVFPETDIASDNGMVVLMHMSGQKLMLLNGGPMFAPTPAVSFMYMTGSEEEVERIWNHLIREGHSLMELGSYPWSSRYGWLQDKFGVSWQLYTGKKEDIRQPVTITLMFTGDQNGRAQEAIGLYTSVFPGSGVQGVLTYGDNGGDVPNHIMHAQFHINGYYIMCMDSTGPHDFNFTEGTSLVVECGSQEEIDHYWNELTAGGGAESMCGWLKDKFGFSWQIIPDMLPKLMSKGDPERTGKMMQALMQMKKLRIAELESAYHS